jgi:alkylhydroperoxidase family enzyme
VELLGDATLVNAVLDDHRTVRDDLRALFVFVEKVNRSASAIGQSDIDAAKAAGWSDEALYDAVTVCALFNFYNRWADATGVAALTPEGYAAAGKRLATQGYAAPRPPA